MRARLAVFLAIAACCALLAAAPAQAEIYKFMTSTGLGSGENHFGPTLNTLSYV
jgi:hypothetical protein